MLRIQCSKKHFEERDAPPSCKYRLFKLLSTFHEQNEHLLKINEQYKMKTLLNETLIGFEVTLKLRRFYLSKEETEAKNNLFWYGAGITPAEYIMPAVESSKSPFIKIHNVRSHSRSALNDLWWKMCWICLFSRVSWDGKYIWVKWNVKFWTEYGKLLRLSAKTRLIIKYYLTFCQLLERVKIKTLHSINLKDFTFFSKLTVLSNTSMNQNIIILYTENR